MIRGIERRLIFYDEKDYEDLLLRLDRLIPQLGFLCFAWVLMPNHAHFALRTGDVPLSRFMSRLTTGYAGRFNRRHGRVGHLLQNRYRARRVEGDEDLLNLVTYIHCNPVRARLVRSSDELQDFAWSGHASLIGARRARPFEACSATLSLFAARPAVARRVLRARMRELGSAPAGRYERFDVSRGARIRVPAGEAESPDLVRLIQAVCVARGLNPADIGSGRRGRAAIEARSEIAYRAARELGLPGSAVARALGVSEATVSRAIGPHRRRLGLDDGAGGHR